MQGQVGKSGVWRVACGVWSVDSGRPDRGIAGSARFPEDTGYSPDYEGNTESQVWKLIDPLTARFYCTLAQLSAAR